MDNLKIHFHGCNKMAIEDLNKPEVNISDRKWDFLFNFFKDTTAYFNGFRTDFTDSSFEDTIDSLSEEILVDLGSNHFELFFRFKESSLLYNRNLIYKLWRYYEFPAFVFLVNRSEEPNLVSVRERSFYIPDILTSATKIYIMDRSFEQNVIWLESSFIDEKLNELLEQRG